MIQDPAGQKGTVEPQLEARGDSTYRCSYQPTMEGVHTVHVTFAGVPIPRSPYTVTVGQGRPVLAAVSLPLAGTSHGRVSWGGHTPAPWHPGSLCFHCLGELCFLPCWDPSSCSSRLLCLSLSPHASTFGRTCSSCLETCCSLLCPQGQRYLNLSFSGRGGLGRGGGQCGAVGRKPITSWSGPQALGSWSLSVCFLHGPHYLLGPSSEGPATILMAQPWGKQGRG